MKEDVKNMLGRTISVGVLAIAAAGLWYVYAYSQSIEPTSFRSFSVTGESKVVAVPDVATFTFSVLTEGGKDVGALQSENTNKVNQAIELVKKNGVQSPDVSTEGYQIEPRYTYFTCPQSITAGNTSVKPCPPPEIAGYSITQTVLVKVRDFTQIGKLLSGVAAAGANRVSSLSFVIDDPSSVQAQARLKAIQKAKEKAAAVAKAGGFSVGRLLGIDEGGYSPYANNLMYAKGSGADMATAAPEAAPVIEPGSQDVSVTVTLRYEIK